MKYTLFSAFLVNSIILLAVLAGCKDENSQPVTLAQAVTGTFQGTLQNWADNTTKVGYEVELVELSDSLVELRAEDFPNVLVILEGNPTFAILGNSDSLNNLGYVVRDKELTFLCHNSKFAFSGKKD
ncbi:MAG: hypothetical protein MUC59_06180 [Saprospiraceae bacterium]|jgi:hypothetical protein|nr:hypothetical protein [Saprospiraceae bacterium]